MMALKTNLQPIVLTPGDPEGIGPEITWKAIQALRNSTKTPLLCVGAEAPFKKLKAPLVHFDPEDPELPTSRKAPFIWLLPAPESAPSGKFLEGFQSGWSIERATHLVLDGFASALVTGPISKDRLQKGGFIYPGHTEFLASLCQTKEVTMMLANSQLRVSLVTTHVGIQNISSTLTRAKIRRAILQTAEGLRTFWRIPRPKIAVTALNPHAGESGLFGREEIDIIQPELDSINQEFQGEFEVSGPFPADTLFAQHILKSQKTRSKSNQKNYPKNNYDAIVSMYHDQGLIPVKLLDFHNTVNVTLGLPMIRTSVDHGVGFDIVGKGIADPSSLCAAIQLAIHFVQKKCR
jgi:4-hydroxythreonine-4-phosphate dehydrogenase